MDYDKEYFKGKTAVITGAASGIGLALTEELLGSGVAKIVMADINQEGLSEHETRLKKQYGDESVKGIVCDVTVEENLQDMIENAANFFCVPDGGKFDILFNNAGAGFPGWFEETGKDRWKVAFDLNFYSALYGIRAALPIMKKQGGGQIINIISGIAFAPMAQQTLYSATKAALNGLSLALRYELWDDNIKISSATPGTTATNIFKSEGYDTPDFAQSPQQSVSRILRGVVTNERIIYGDDMDLEGTRDCFAFESNSDKDMYFVHNARERKAGRLAL